MISVLATNLKTRPSQLATEDHLYFLYPWTSQMQGKKLSLRAGLEPAWGDPIGFQVQHINHSAITSCNKGSLFFLIFLDMETAIIFPQLIMSYAQ